MTRKDELEARAKDYVSLFVMSGAEPAATKNLAWMLEQVEREVWGKAIAILDGGRFLSNSSMERVWVNSVIKVLRQQQELG